MNECSLAAGVDLLGRAERWLLEGFILTFDALQAGFCALSRVLGWERVIVVINRAHPSHNRRFNPAKPVRS